MPGPRRSRRRRNGRLLSGVFHIVVNCGFCEREVVRCIESLRMQTFAEWRAEVWDAPTLTRDGSFVALDHGRPAAIALLYVAPELGRAVSAFTATLPQFRGRGLALAAKIATMRWAEANGIVRASTANDDTNAPMLAINARLGYKPIGRLLTMRRSL